MHKDHHISILQFNEVKKNLPEFVKHEWKSVLNSFGQQGLKSFSLVLMIGVLLGCGSNNVHYSSENYIEAIDEEYPDGTYCADVNYHNPNTGTSSDYTLNVEVEDKEVVKIYWGNGGWLDDDHFVPEELDYNGYCSFTSDKGYEYEITITGEECSYTNEDELENDVENDLEEVTCPKCGNEKDSYDDYCDECQHDIEHTCPRCGEVDDFMYFGDDYCSNCKDELENDDY